MEVLLRLTGAFNVYSEKIGGEYSSYWDYRHKGHYKIMPRNKRIYYEQKEFTIDFKSNSLGMRNTEFATSHPDSVYRIFCLGDSYTEGDGAEWGESYPRHLDRLLNDYNPKPIYYEVINAGKNGSDIIYAEKMFINVLSSFQPNLVIFAINDSDLEDIIQRGGKERFKSNNTTVFRNGPWYEDLYAKSHALRMIIHVPLLKNKLFLGPIANKKQKKKAVKVIESSMVSIKQFCDANDIEVRFLIHPLAWQVKLNKNNKALTREELLERYEKISPLSNINLNNVGNTYNLYPALIQTFRGKKYTEYAWPLNGHYNADGYEAFAKELLNTLREDPILSQSLGLEN